MWRVARTVQASVGADNIGRPLFASECEGLLLDYEAHTMGRPHPFAEHSGMLAVVLQSQNFKRDEHCYSFSTNHRLISDLSRTH